MFVNIFKENNDKNLIINNINNEILNIYNNKMFKLSEKKIFDKIIKLKNNIEKIWESEFSQFCSTETISKENLDKYYFIENISNVIDYIISDNINMINKLNVIYEIFNLNEYNGNLDENIKKYINDINVDIKYFDITLDDKHILRIVSKFSDIEKTFHRQNYMANELVNENNFKFYGISKFDEIIIRIFMEIHKMENYLIVKSFKNNFKLYNFNNKNNKDNLYIIKNKLLEKGKLYIDIMK